MLKTQAHIDCQSRRYLDVVLHEEIAVPITVISGQISGEGQIQVFIAIGRASGSGAVIRGIEPQQEIRKCEENSCAKILKVGFIGLIAGEAAAESQTMTPVNPSHGIFQHERILYEGR